MYKKMTDFEALGYDVICAESADETQNPVLFAALDWIVPEID